MHTERHDRLAGLLCVGLMILASASGARAAELWTVRDGSVVLLPDFDALSRLGLSIDAQGGAESTRPDGALSDALDGRARIAFSFDGGVVSGVVADDVGFRDGLSVAGPNGRAVVWQVRMHWDESLAGSPGARLASTTIDDAVLEAHNVRAGFDRRTGTLRMPAQEATISAALARALGDETLAGAAIGRVVVTGRSVWDGGDQPGSIEPIGAIRSTGGSVGGAALSGPDMTFCELYGLRQFGRVGDVVGLALSTTSWNVGDEDLMWFHSPGERHPFIAMNLFREHEGRFEQIGQSWLKHGFFALDSEQCDTNCTYETGHGPGDWLGVGCTDTYSASLNASQSGLGPRHEVNPWTGEWTHAGSHFDVGSPAHDAVDHRLQVHDADLDPVTNAGATYYAEGYYVIGDDVDAMNSASWKPVTVSGGAGGTYSFGMSGASTPPNIGFAIDAWAGARQTVIARELPVVEFQSPDGRCVLAVKTEDLGGGIWSYEYALYNIDLNQKVKSFSVPVAPGTSVSRREFHAVASHGEPYSNDPWTSVVDGGAVTWSTVDNPLRWGTMYNFRFRANAPPGETTATLGMYEERGATSIAGPTTGPEIGDAVCEVVDPPSPIELAVAKSRYISFDPRGDSSLTAIRVSMSTLISDEPGGSADRPDIKAFEGDVRWVGPPQEYAEASVPPPTFTAAALQCEPYFADWSAIAELNVYGAEVVPNSLYDVQRVHVDCAAELDEESHYSVPVTVATGRWGDVTAPFAGDDGAALQPDFSDVAALVSKFAGSIEPSKASAQMQPNIPDPAEAISFSDIADVVDAFTGVAYPHPGPTPCP